MTTIDTDGIDTDKSTSSTTFEPPYGNIFQ